MEIIGQIQVGETVLGLWNNGYITDVNNQPIGTFTEGEQEGVWALLDNNDQFYATLDTNTGGLTFANGSFEPFQFQANADFSGEDVRGTMQGQPGQGGFGQAAMGGNYVGSVQVFDAQGNPQTYSFGEDGGIYVEGNPNPVGTYSHGTQPNTFDLKTIDGQPFGTFDHNTGTLTTAQGTGHAAWQGPAIIPHTAPITQTSQYSTSQSQRGGSKYRSGVDWSSPVASALQQPMIDTALALPGLAEQAGTQAQEHYVNLMDQAMGSSGFQGYLNQLANRGVLTSSLTESTLANAQQQAAQNVGSQAFLASLAGTQAQMQVPGQLSSYIGQLGGQQGSQSQSSSGGTQGSQTNITTDPLRPHNAWLNYLNTG